MSACWITSGTGGGAGFKATAERGDFEDAEQSCLIMEEKKINIWVNFEIPIS